MSNVYQKVGGSPSEITELYYRNAGSPVAISEVYEKQSGSPVLIWAAQQIGADWPPSGDVSDVQLSPTDSVAYFTIKSDGTFIAVGNTTNWSGGGDYLTQPGVGEGANFYFKFHRNSGTAMNYGDGLSEDTYYQLNSDRTMGQNVTGTGVRSGNFTITIAKDASGTGAVTWTGNISAEVTV